MPQQQVLAFCTNWERLMMFQTEGKTHFKDNKDFAHPIPSSSRGQSTSSPTKIGLLNFLKALREGKKSLFLSTICQKQSNCSTLNLRVKDVTVDMSLCLYQYFPINKSLFHLQNVTMSPSICLYVTTAENVSGPGSGPVSVPGPGPGPVPVPVPVIFGPDDWSRSQF